VARVLGCELGLDGGWSEVWCAVLGVWWFRAVFVGACGFEMAWGGKEEVVGWIGDYIASMTETMPLLALE